ncbi:hypothetical protein GCM10009843_26610 [Nocardioides bigeumensis]|uniref:Uncharacterized protein n=1 Tax=Nocardioides bigeumensis TaxID=433657 RepID=A0ABN2YHE7_9ACTN
MPAQHRLADQHGGGDHADLPCLPPAHGGRAGEPGHDQEGSSGVARPGQQRPRLRQRGHARQYRPPAPAETADVPRTHNPGRDVKPSRILNRASDLRKRFE